MIIGIGTDLIEIERVRKACEKEAFLRKYYTEKERELIIRKKQRSASHFAVKEAVAKVLGCGFSGCHPVEIEVLRDEMGKPYVCLYGRAKQRADELRIDRIHVSISDTCDYVTAFAVGEGEASCNIS